jgi:ABC-type transporter Mla MlaB component
MEVEQLDGCTRLRIRGPVRLGEVAELLELARAASSRDLPVELDLGEAEHLHTAAWQVLFALEKALLEQGHALSVTHSSEAARALLELFERNNWLTRGEEAV